MTTANDPASATRTMKTIRFGIEIETTGLPRPAAARAIHSVVGGHVRYVGAGYDTWECVAPDGRIWKAMRDSSVTNPDGSAEIVSPILNYVDIETVQEIVRALRKAGARTDKSCGIHVHLDGARFDARAVVRFVQNFNKQEELLMHALGVTGERRARWCKDVDQSFLAKIEREKPTTLEALNIAWYGYHNPRPTHYDQTRYRALNLHALWQKGTIEIRAFEATLHAGKVKSYIQLVLALGEKAIDSRSAVSARRALSVSTAKYDFRVVMIKLGLIGEEFATCRLHMLAGLQGDGARKRGRVAVAA